MEDDQDDFDVESIEHLLNADLNPEDHSNDKNTNDNLQTDTKTGYNVDLGDTWIYPINYPIREYQYKITREALEKNTLVCLPTGLGKTFIAAVVIYNFYRWFPQGKIIFMAPTRTLAKQQISACMDIAAIPAEHTAEITGSLQASKRESLWKAKRVFFITPQTLQNDFKAGIFPIVSIRLLVIDEAHHTRGKYSYVEVVEAIREKHQFFRIVALSATPGKNTDEVAQIIKCLHINHLEIRNEESEDVVPYVHSKNIQTIVIKLDPVLESFRTSYLSILDTYVRRLLECGVISGTTGTLHRGRIVMQYKDYQSAAARGNKHPQHAQVVGDFTMCVSLYHGLDLLVNHGYRVFLKFFSDTNNKGWLNREYRLMQLRQEIIDRVGDFNLDVKCPDGEILKTDKPIEYGHPKFKHLADTVKQHFEKGEETRCIVFCEFRDTVALVNRRLLEIGPPVLPRIFTGSGMGSDEKTFTKKQQNAVMEQFRSGACNVLVSTCIAEEGIDVGEVDLIVCFDTSTNNPRRLVQRMGRTGRKKTGRVVLLATEGREASVVMQSMVEKNHISTRIQNCNVIRNLLKQMNAPRMIPENIELKCQQMCLNIKPVIEKISPTKTTTKKGRKTTGKKNADLRDLFSKQKEKLKNAKLQDTIVEDTTTKKKVRKSIVDLTCCSSDDEFLSVNSINNSVIEDQKENKTKSQELDKKKPVLSKDKKSVGTIKHYLQVTPKKNKNNSFTNSNFCDLENHDLNISNTTKIADDSLINKSSSFAYHTNDLSAGLVDFMSKVNLNEIKTLMNTSCEFCEKFPHISSLHCEDIYDNQDISFLDEPFKAPSLNNLKESCMKIIEKFGSRNEENESSFSIDKTDSDDEILKSYKTYCESSLNHDVTKDVKDDNSQNNILTEEQKDILSFFKLNDIMDIFGDNTNPNTSNIGQSALQKDDSKNLEVVNKSLNKTKNMSLNESDNKSFLTVTQMVDVINAFDSNDSIRKTTNKSIPEINQEESFNNDSTFCEEAEGITRSSAKKNKLNLSRLSNIKIIPKTRTNNVSESGTFLNQLDNIWDNLDFVDDNFKNDLLSLAGIKYCDKDSECRFSIIDVKSESKADINLVKGNENLSRKLNFSNFSSGSNKTTENPNSSKVLELNPLDFIYDSDSDEVFERGEKNILETSNLSQFKYNKQSDRSFVASQKDFQTKLNTYKKSQNTKSRQKKRSNALSFLDMEALVSGSDDDNIDEATEEDMNFVVNEHHDGVDITEKYLRSIRSPLKVGGFKIPKLVSRKHEEWDLTQVADIVDNNYEVDSFVVHDEKVEYDCNVSELEILENKLRKNKNKGRLNTKHRIIKPILEDNDTSDEENVIISKQKINNNADDFICKTSSDEEDLTIRPKRKANYNKRFAKKRCVLSDTDSNDEEL